MPGPEWTLGDRNELEPRTRVTIDDHRLQEQRAPHGFVKLLAAPQTGEILGAQIVGLEADEMIHELIAVMYYQRSAADLLRMPHDHPTSAEIVTYPAESVVERLGA